MIKPESLTKKANLEYASPYYCNLKSWKSMEVLLGSYCCVTNYPNT